VSPARAREGATFVIARRGLRVRVTTAGGVGVPVVVPGGGVSGVSGGGGGGGVNVLVIVQVNMWPAWGVKTQLLRTPRQSSS
jgi:uncharacterized membrane protein